MRFFNFTNHQTGQETALKRIRSKSCRSSPKWHNKKKTHVMEMFHVIFLGFSTKMIFRFFARASNGFTVLPKHPMRMIFRSKKTNKNFNDTHKNQHLNWPPFKRKTCGDSTCHHHVIRHDTHRNQPLAFTATPKLLGISVEQCKCSTPPAIRRWKAMCLVKRFQLKWSTFHTSGQMKYQYTVCMYI